MFPSMSRARFVVALAATVLGVGTPRRAEAFTIYSVVARGCHEEITMAALDRARAVRPEARAMPPETRDDRAFLDDLELPPDDRLGELAAATLVNAVRFNDLHGHGPNEVEELALLHGDPGVQPEHCLRAPGNDEPSGTEDALRACRAYVHDKVREALDGLDASGAPDVHRRTTLRITLALRGRADVSLPVFWAAMGQALHAVQDGFSHSYRTADRTKVHEILNYVDVIRGQYAEERDGPRHSLALDECGGDDPVQHRNVEVATQASFEILAAALDSGATVDGRLAAVDDVLARYFSYEPGCTASNAWCDAPEARLRPTSACGCSTPGLGAGGAAWLVLGAAAVGVVVARRRRLRRTTASLAVAIGLASAPSTARAETPPPPAMPVAPLTPAEAAAAETEQAHMTPFALYVAGAGSVSNPAIAGMIGARYRASERWVFGIDGEYNAWYGVQAGRLRSGALDLYASATVRFPMRFAPVNLRSTLQLGVARQLVDLYGVPSGTTGVFAGLNPLGVEVKLSPRVYVVAYPLGVAVPASQLAGAPFAYPQYRTTIGIELSP